LCNLKFRRHVSSSIVTNVHFSVCCWITQLPVSESVFCHPCDIIIMNLIIPTTFITYCDRFQFNYSPPLTLFNCTFIFIFTFTDLA